MPYNRMRDVPRAIPVWPSDLADDLVSRSKLVAKIEAALSVERKRHTERHWAYSLPRHGSLLAVYREEKAALDAMWKREHAL